MSKKKKIHPSVRQTMPSFVANKNRKLTSYLSFLVLLWHHHNSGSSSCGFFFTEAFLVPRFHAASSEQTLLFHRTITPAFTVRLSAKQRQNLEYSVLNEDYDEEEEEDDDLVVTPTTNQNDHHDNVKGDVDHDDYGDDDDETISLKQPQMEILDEEDEDDDYYEDSKDVGPSAMDAKAHDKKEESRLYGATCLGALFKPTVASSSSSAAAVVTIEVGDVNLARKAWKKRRRSGSPMLVPCSILSVDPKTMIRSNLMYLLYKYGVESKASAHQRPGLELSMSEVAQFHRKQFKTSLLVRNQIFGSIICSNMLLLLLTFIWLHALLLSI
jgi:hypothetical protein